jgi:hypothetical protein
MSKLAHHPLSDIFPEMPDADYQELKSDIQKNGLLLPIIIHEGKILDGRHRYKACLELKIEPKYEIFARKEKAADFVFSTNSVRRHLTKSQRACVAAIRMQLEKKNPVDNLVRGATPKKNGEPKKDNWRTRTVYRISKESDVGSTAIMQAAVLLNHDRPSFDKVFRGEAQVNTLYHDYRRKVGTIKNKTKKSICNIESFKSEIVLPNCFDDRSVIDEFIKTMNKHGWHLEMLFKEGKIYANWFGNGFPDLQGWNNIQPEFEFKRAVIVAAREKLTIVKHKAIAA